MNSLLKTTLFVLLLTTGFLLQSCSDSSEPTVAQVKLTMKAKTATSTFGNGRVMSEGLVFNEVLLGVTELEFETLEEQELEDVEGEDENDEVEFEGNFIVDLINGTSTPDFGIADIAPGIYEEMEIEMEPILNDGNTIFVSFDFINANQETYTVEYSNSHSIEYEIEREAGFVLDADAANQMLVQMDLDALFSGIDFNTATVDTDGVIRINADSNGEINSVITENLKQVLAAGEDDNDDGEIDED